MPRSAVTVFIIREEFCLIPVCIISQNVVFFVQKKSTATKFYLLITFLHFLWLLARKMHVWEEIPQQEKTRVPLSPPCTDGEFVFLFFRAHPIAHSPRVSKNTC
eukprot:GEMP01052408.1.p1 GENE.GEMP01052408.1~~GEMP01052408.1.p1  ORF type:complete len:104 (+),score=12.02 GEMP01052408.1:147-458(+)